MKNYQETTEILKSFYEDCLRFWKRENAPENALNDLANLKHDPFSPNGELLDKQAIIDFIKKHS